MANTAERVFGYLRKHQNVIVCDDCLQAELKVTQPINRMLDVLSTEYVKREIATCASCGERKLTTMMFRS
jgi:hypothetical protein